MMRRVLKPILVCISLLLTASAHAADTKTVSLNVDQYKRSYVYTVPSHKDKPLPVVLVLPDAGMDGATALQRYRWAALAAREGFIAVGLDPLPIEPEKPEMFQSNPSFWSDGSGRGNAKRGDLDDVSFVRAVLDDLGRRFTIDGKRIYATGFGNGGSMTHLLGIQLSDRISAIAPVSGYVWVSGAPDRPLPVMMIYGSADPVEPIRGGLGLNIWSHQMERVPATTSSAMGWVQMLGCKEGPVGTPLQNHVTQTSWRGCNGDGSVDYIIVPDQGHHWPKGEDDDQPSLGASSDALDATDFIWEWFKAHPRS